MSVRVRLTRVGSKKNAMWRVVVADQRSPRDGRFIEMIGHYNPQTQPSQIVIDRDRLDHWLQRGAQPTNTVRKLMRAPNTEVTAATPPPDAPEPPSGEEPAASEPDEATPEPAAEAAPEADAEATAPDEAATPDATEAAPEAAEATGDDEASGS
jgi:small subunit ribosomal protein S16